MKNKEIGWPWFWFSINPNITTDIIEKFMYLPWSYYTFSMNPNINVKFVKTYYHKAYNWKSLSANNCLNMDEIQEYRDLPWHVSSMCENTFEKQFDRFMTDSIKDFRNARIIQRWWLKLKYNPNTKIGNRFVNQLYEENFSES